MPAPTPPTEAALRDRDPASVRCRTPGCGKLLIEELRGTAVVRCGRCKARQTATRP